MADNRIYLRCAGCGKDLYLGKRLGGCYYWENYGEDGTHLEDNLNEFFEKHLYCNGRGPDCFYIGYDFEDEADVKVREDSMSFTKGYQVGWAEGRHKLDVDINEMREEQYRGGYIDGIKDCVRDSLLKQEGAVIVPDEKGEKENG